VAKPNLPRPLSRILAVDAQISAWHERMERESRLTAAVRRLLPRALADRVRVAEAEPPTLTLAGPGRSGCCGGPPALTPTSSPAFGGEGWDFTQS
jgi:hypothetical protein